MKPDFPDSFLEPSGGRGYKFPRRRKKYERQGDEPLKPVGGMRRVHAVAGKFGTKYTGTDFAILRRFLQSRVGRPWDEVYSEISEHADTRNWTGQQFREWVEYTVELNCRLDEDGNVLDSQDRPMYGNQRWHLFYVHPKTGILHKLQYKRERRNYKSRKKIHKVGDQLYHKHKDIWYRVEMKPWPKIRYPYGYAYSFYDYATYPPDAFGVTNYNQATDKYGLDPDNKVWYCISKESANSKEIEKIEETESW